MHDVAFLRRTGGFALLSLLAACASTADRRSEAEVAEEASSFISDIEEANKGKFLAELDDAITAWNSLVLSGEGDDDERRAHALETQIGYRARKRFDMLVAELEAGPPANRIVSAIALGFSGAREALAPLVAALDDPDQRVEINALIGLRMLGDPQTPVELLCQRVRGEANDLVRVQAAYALNHVVQAGAAGECVRDTAREGLVDEDPGVQAQCALLAATLLDASSIPALEHLLYSDTPLVAHAGARALTWIGERDAHAKGEAARALTKALEGSNGRGQREHLLRHLMLLSRRNFGEETDAWVAWARDLP